MNHCNHSPNVPFFVLLKLDRYRNGEQLRFTCKRCGQSIIPDKHINTNRFCFLVGFVPVCLYLLFIRDCLESVLNRALPALPILAVRLISVIPGILLALMFTDIVLFILLHCIRWRDDVSERSDVSASEAADK